MDINRPRRCRSTAKAVIRPKTLFGEKFVDIDPGPHEATGPFLKDEGQIKPTRSGGFELEQVLADLYPILKAIKPEELATVVDTLADGGQGEGAAINRTLVNLEQLADVQAAHIRPTRAVPRRPRHDLDRARQAGRRHRGRRPGPQRRASRAEPAGRRAGDLARPGSPAGRRRGRRARSQPTLPPEGGNRGGKTVQIALRPSAPTSARSSPGCASSSRRWPRSAASRSATAPSWPPSSSVFGGGTCPAGPRSPPRARPSTGPQPIAGANKAAATSAAGRGRRRRRARSTDPQGGSPSDASAPHARQARAVIFVLPCSAITVYLVLRDRQRAVAQGRPVPAAQQRVHAAARPSTTSPACCPTTT